MNKIFLLAISTNLSSLILQIVAYFNPSFKLYLLHCVSQHNICAKLHFMCFLWLHSINAVSTCLFLWFHLFQKKKTQKHKKYKKKQKIQKIRKTQKSMGASTAVYCNINVLCLYLSFGVNDKCFKCVCYAPLHLADFCCFGTFFLQSFLLCVIYFFNAFFLSQTKLKHALSFFFCV